jgi:hypothetical protein
MLQKLAPTGKELLESLAPRQIVPLAKPFGEFFGEVPPLLRIADGPCGGRDRQHRPPERRAVDGHLESFLGHSRCFARSASIICASSAADLVSLPPGASVLAGTASTVPFLGNFGALCGTSRARLRFEKTRRSIKSRSRVTPRVISHGARAPCSNVEIYNARFALFFRVRDKFDSVRCGTQKTSPALAPLCNSEEPRCRK